MTTVIGMMHLAARDDNTHAAYHESHGPQDEIRHGEDEKRARPPQWGEPFNLPPMLLRKGPSHLQHAQTLARPSSARFDWLHAEDAGLRARD